MGVTPNSAAASGVDTSEDGTATFNLACHPAVSSQAPATDVRIGIGHDSASPAFGSTAMFGNGRQSRLLPPIGPTGSNLGEECDGADQFTFHSHEPLLESDACDDSESANLSACHSASALIDVMRVAGNQRDEDQHLPSFASREVLLRIISTLQADKASMDAQLRALTAKNAN